MNEKFTSQTSNFISAMSTDVDPRTGQFMVNLPVVSLVGNHQLGPELPLSLSYSSLNNINSGFGTGFALSLTQFNNRTNLLELSNGEKYRVSPGTDEVRNQKLKNFRFAFTNGQGDRDGYTIFWKDGKTEILVKTEDDETFVTTTVISPAGRQLYLSWDWSGQVSRLSEVRDESVTLCRVNYRSGSSSVTLWPDTGDEVRIAFDLLNEMYLDRISRAIPGGDGLNCDFSYDLLPEMTGLLLTGVKYPTGMTDNVVYNQAEGLHYPAASGITARLPVVLTHTRNPGAGQPETIRHFSYTEQNFLGFNGNFGDWSADSDYIYTTLTDYTYGSTESIISGGVTVTTEREYNNYHLQISEETRKDSSIIREETTYYAIPYAFIDGQPAQFQMPEKKIVTLTDTSLPAAEQTREEITETMFDEHGNPVSMKAPDGTLTTYEFYPAEGGDHCPAEPNGFVRFLKSVKVTPRVSDYDDTSEQITTYTYSLLGNSSDCVVQDTESVFSGRTLLSVRVTEYQAGIGHTEYGRVTAFTDTLYDPSEGGQSFTGRQDFDTEISNDGLMTQTTTFTGYDGLQSSVTQSRSVYNGLLHSEVSSQDIVTQYTYDALGRILTRTQNSGTDYENTTTWEYEITTAGPVTTMRDDAGNQVKLHFDGAGRQIRQQQFDTDHTQEWFEIASTQYNAFGQEQSGTGQDWITDGEDSGRHFTVSSIMDYDNWGNPSETAFSDSLRELTQSDPVRRVTRTYSQGGEGVAQVKSGSVSTRLDKVTGLPVQETMTDVSGAEQDQHRYTYDGLNRLREEKDTDGNITTYRYDLFDREISRTLADGTVVTREYAPYLSGGQVSNIQITGPGPDGKTLTMGQREYDSLGRLISETTGGRMTGYRYEGASPVPAEITFPSGNSLNYDYIPELGNVPCRVSGEGINQTYDYDNLTGVLLSAREADTGYDCVWSPSVKLIQEQFTRQGSDQQADYTSTLGGSPLSYTDITGAQTCYTRDEYGRVTEISDSVLDVVLNYDALTRLSVQTVTDRAGGAELTTAFEYDDFSREISRTLTDSRGTTLATEMNRLKNGLLSRRVTRQNSTVLKDEHYEYDCRHRLVSYLVSGSTPPPDAYGNTLTGQQYRYDAMNNLTSVTTTLTDGSEDTATYHYLNTADPTQLSEVTHTHTSYPQTINLEYDANGRMTRDEAGRTLAYDVRGRLTGVSGENINGGSYQYDALNRLVSQNVSSGDVRELYYRGNTLVNEVLTVNQQEIRLIKQGAHCLGVSNGDYLTLTGTDHNNSLVWSENKNDGTTLHNWSPYGSGNPVDFLPGFNGERCDPVSGSYHLGNGYRAYNPVLMRFNCPDSLSPFGEGGINPYAYCAGDPVNFTDPSGHMSTGAGVAIGVGIAGILAAVFTAGTSLIATAIAMGATGTVATGAAISTWGVVSAAVGSVSVTSLVVGGMGVISDVTAIASGATEKSNPNASAVLGWVSLGLGIAAVGTFAGKQAMNWADKNAFIGLRRHLYNIREQGLGGKGGPASAKQRASLLSELAAKETMDSPGYLRDIQQTTINSFTRGSTPMSSSPLPRQQLNIALGSSTDGEQSFTRLLRGVNSNLASHNDIGLTSAHAQRYAEISRQVENRSISNTTAHLYAASEWTKQKTGAGVVGTVFNGAGALFSGLIDAAIRKRGY
ncbi:RHS repeat-associated core domain-containing protein [Serratia quinivorans]|uniref:RHS repeat-associated core domain-containing protein n=1 Tax=Serratia quinivorans TaxID=137545 RepID=UPI00107E7641|nr:RHS repeat-associated core domain-containing protein [Serratia quinivorans]QBX68329.1 RHS repeat protein [Serratia quinivorans]